MYDLRRTVVALIVEPRRARGDNGIRAYNHVKYDALYIPRAGNQ